LFLAILVRRIAAEGAVKGGLFWCGQGRGARRSRRCLSSSALTGTSIGWPGAQNIVTTNADSASARLFPSW
jgi:hypothetical protein